MNKPVSKQYKRCYMRCNEYARQYLENSSDYSELFFISRPNGLSMSFRVWIILPSHAMIIKKLEETNTNTIT